MNKIFYAILLLTELLAAFAGTSLVWNNLGWLHSVIIIAIWAILMIWKICQLVKATDAAGKRKALRGIALVMLFPTVVFIILFIWFFIGLMSVI